MPCAASLSCTESSTRAGRSAHDDDALYVDWQKKLDPGAVDVRARLVRSFLRNASAEHPITRLLTGHRGSGKTTELNRVAKQLGEGDGAKRVFVSTLFAQQWLDSRLGEGNTLKSLGDAALMQNRYPDAIALHEQALPIYRGIGDRLGEANTLQSLGQVALVQDRYPDAIALYDQALPIYREIGHRRGEAIALAGHATALAANGSPSAPLVLEEAVRRTADAGLEARSKELQRLLDETTVSAEQIGP